MLENWQSQSFLRSSPILPIHPFARVDCSLEMGPSVHMWALEKGGGRGVLNRVCDLEIPELREDKCGSTGHCAFKETWWLPPSHGLLTGRGDRLAEIR